MISSWSSSSEVFVVVAALWVDPVDSWETRDIEPRRGDADNVVLWLAGLTVTIKFELFATIISVTCLREKINNNHWQSLTAVFYSLRLVRKMFLEMIRKYIKQSVKSLKNHCRISRRLNYFQGKFFIMNVKIARNVRGADITIRDILVVAIVQTVASLFHFSWISLSLIHISEPTRPY